MKLYYWDTALREVITYIADRELREETSMTFPAKRRLASGNWAIDNGDQAPLLDACPCCGVLFKNEAAADSMLTALEDNKLTFGTAIELLNLRRKVES